MKIGFRVARNGKGIATQFRVEIWKIFSDGEREQLLDSRIIMAVHFLHIILDGDILKGRPVGSTVE